MYTSLTPHLLHGRQLASEAFYELNPDHEPPAADEDSGRFVLVIENGIARTEWPWNPTYAGMEVPGDDGGLKDRLNGWLLRPEWQGKVSVQPRAVCRKSPQAWLTLSVVSCRVVLAATCGSPSAWMPTTRRSSLTRTSKPQPDGRLRTSVRRRILPWHGLTAVSTGTDLHRPTLLPVCSRARPGRASVCASRVGDGV